MAARASPSAALPVILVTAAATSKIVPHAPPSPWKSQQSPTHVYPISFERLYNRTAVLLLLIVAQVSHRC